MTKPPVLLSPAPEEADIGGTNERLSIKVKCIRELYLPIINKAVLVS